jgi:hypothetical protein
MPKFKRQHLLGPEITGAACPVSAPRSLRYCEYWSLLVRAWMTSRGSVGPKVARGWTVIIRRNVCGSRQRSSSGVGARFLPGWASLRGVFTRWCDWRTEWWKLSDSRESWVLRKLRLDGMLIETEIESWKGESCWSPVGTVKIF